MVSTTTRQYGFQSVSALWFAWKYLPLWYQQQHWRPDGGCCCRCDLLENIYLCGINNNLRDYNKKTEAVVICLKISTFVVSTTTVLFHLAIWRVLWFAWKYLPLWYQQQLQQVVCLSNSCCDLLENIYLCGINNNLWILQPLKNCVVICLKISTFVVSTTTLHAEVFSFRELWFAWKYLPLWYQQQLDTEYSEAVKRCDLLENIYLCGINNNRVAKSR